MSPRRRKVEDADVFAAMGRVMRRVGPAELTLGAIAAEAGVTAGALVQRFGSKRELVLAHWRQAAAGSGDLRPQGPRPPGRPSARCVPPRPFTPSWPSHRVPHCGTSPTCKAIGRTRRSAGIGCGMPAQRGRASSSCWPKPCLDASCVPTRMSRRWRE